MVNSAKASIGSYSPSRQRNLGGVPETLFSNSAAEYWRGDGALVNVDPISGQDLPEDPDVRTYLPAGTDHFGGATIEDMLSGTNLVHHLDATPVHRALLVALEKWVRNAVEPPSSRVPRTGDGTAVSRNECGAASIMLPARMFRHCRSLAASTYGPTPTAA